MNKDIIRYILTSNETKNNNISKEKQFHKIFDNNFETELNKNEKKEKENKNFEIPKMTTNSNEKNSLDYYSENENKNEKINIVMKKLQLINIIQSFFCCKDNKIKLINLSDEVINKDICIESILKRLYLLEKEFDILRNEKFSEILDIIDIINRDLIDKVKDKAEKDLNKTNNNNNEIT